MPRLSTLSNPTGLVDLAKQRIAIALDESEKRKAFSLTRLDLSGLSLPSALNVIVIARRGPSEERFDLGGIADWDKSFQDVSDIGNDGPWAFRVLLVHPGAAKLVAAAENIRPVGQGDSESFIALEPADLDQVVWEIAILEQDGRAVIRFNKNVYQSSGEAEADRHFVALVLPEAIRQLAIWHTRVIGALEDTPWEAFKAWLNLHGITETPEEEWSEETQITWSNSVVRAFCARFQFATMLNESRKKGSEE